MRQRIQQGEGPAFEWWMVVNVAVGIGQFAFIPLLIVPYVTGVTGRPADGGIILSIIGLSALTAPLLGGFADRYHAHRLMLTLGLTAMAVSYLLYAWSASTEEVYAYVAIIVGVGIAIGQSVAPAFIVDIGISRRLQAWRLTVYNLLTSAGVVIGGLLLGLVAAWTFPQKFMLAAGINALIAVVVWFASSAPSRRIVPRQVPSTEEARERKQPSALGQVLRTSFGVLLLMLFFVGLGYNAIIGQIGNIMHFTFGVSPATTSFLISLTGLINMAGFILAGFWLSRAGGLPVATGSQSMHLTGVLGLALWSLIAAPLALLVGLFMLIFYMGEPYGRIPQPVLGERFSLLPSATAVGWYIGVLAGSASIAGLLAGVLAQAFGYSAVIWMAVAAFALGLLINGLGLWPIERKKRAAERTGHAKQREAATGDGTPAPA